MPPPIYSSWICYNNIPTRISILCINNLILWNKKWRKTWFEGNNLFNLDHEWCATRVLIFFLFCERCTKIQRSSPQLSFIIFIQIWIIRTTQFWWSPVVKFVRGGHETLKLFCTQNVEIFSDWQFHSIILEMILSIPSFLKEPFRNSKPNFLKANVTMTTSILLCISRKQEQLLKIWPNCHHHHEGLILTKNPWILILVKQFLKYSNHYKLNKKDSDYLCDFNCYSEIQLGLYRGIYKLIFDWLAKMNRNIQSGRHTTSNDKKKSIHNLTL